MKKFVKLFMVIFAFVGIITLSVGFYAFPALLAVFLSQPLWYLLYIIHGAILLFMLLAISQAEEVEGYDH